ncbi:DUF433 domain-containing protein [Niabella aquatica]
MLIANRITINSEVCNGKPAIRNTRYTIDLILDLLSAGMTPAEIIEDIRAGLAYASQLSKVKTIHRIVA